MGIDGWVADLLFSLERFNSSVFIKDLRTSEANEKKKRSSKTCNTLATSCTLENKKRILRVTVESVVSYGSDSLSTIGRHNFRIQAVDMEF